MSIQPKKISELDDASVSALATKMEMKVSKVHVFEFENVTGTSTFSVQLPGMTQEIMQSSIVLCAVNRSTDDQEDILTFVPGIDITGTFYIRSFCWFSGDESDPYYTFTIRTHGWTGSLYTTNKTFEKVRLYIIQYKQ